MWLPKKLLFELNKVACAEGKKLEVCNLPQKTNRLKLSTVKLISRRTMGVVIDSGHRELPGQIEESLR